MDYPDWAPGRLAEYLSRPAGDPAWTRKNTKEEESVVVFHRRWALMRIFSGEEDEALLRRLWTDDRMMEVWNPLARRVTDDDEFFAFLCACHRYFHSSSSQPKHTVAERKKFSQQIQDDLTKLDDLLKQSGLLAPYAIYRLISNRTISISDILMEIRKEAKLAGEEECFVKRQNSENADIHYFVRKLSRHLRQKYKQPLHNVVAATTEVVFDRRNISTDYVRELVRRHP